MHRPAVEYKTAAVAVGRVLFVNRLHERGNLHEVWPGSGDNKQLKLSAHEFIPGMKTCPGRVNGGTPTGQCFRLVPRSPLEPFAAPKPAGHFSFWM